MKLTFLVLFVLSVALAVVAVPANHHKKNRGNNMKVEEHTIIPIEGDGTDGTGGDFEWPDPRSIRNFGVPAAFDFGRTKNSNTELVPVKQHGRSNHRSHSH